VSARGRGAGGVGECLLPSKSNPFGVEYLAEGHNTSCCTTVQLYSCRLEAAAALLLPAADCCCSRLLLITS
jgi:hypothetical protein